MQAPGVYHQEISSGKKPIVVGSTSGIGVLLECPFGIVGNKVLCTSLDDAKKAFGGFSLDHYGMYVLQNLYAHGANEVYITRVKRGAGINPSSSQTVGTKTVDYDFLSFGEFGNDAKLTITYADSKVGFKLSIESDGEEVILHEKSGLSAVPTDPDYVFTYMNESCEWLTVTFPVSAPIESDFVASIGAIVFNGGAEGVTEPTATDYENAVKVFDIEKNVRTVIAPDIYSDFTRESKIIDWCEAKKYPMYVTCVENVSNPDYSTIVAGVLTTRAINSKNVVVVYNWVIAIDPLTGGEKFIPPIGNEVGAWIETDNGAEGIHKAPANIRCKNVIGVKDTDIDETGHALLNNAGINVILHNSDGYMIMGARVRTNDTEWMYIHKRRTYLMFATAIPENLSWTNFEVKDIGNGLFGKVTRNLNAFFNKYDRRKVRNGALRNYINPSDPGWYILCDETNNNEIGIVKVHWGISIVDTAEVINCTSSVWDGGSETKIVN